MSSPKQRKTSKIEKHEKDVHKNHHRESSQRSLADVLDRPRIFTPVHEVNLAKPNGWSIVNLLTLILVAVASSQIYTSIRHQGVVLTWQLACDLHREFRDMYLIWILRISFNYAHVVFQRLYSRGTIGYPLHLMLFLTLQAITFSYPLYLCADMMKIVKFTLVLEQLAVLLKIYSYFSVNNLLHSEYLRQVKEDPEFAEKYKEAIRENPDRTLYGRNLTWKDMLYLIFTPTLLYELNEPRMEKIRWRKALTHFIMVYFSFTFIVFYYMQTAFVTLKNIEINNYHCYMEILVQAFILWFLMFILFFCCKLPCMAELTRQRNRRFFGDWWNARDFAEFWRKWNIPVHEWCIRHVYQEIVAKFKIPKKSAKLMVFVVSAFFHELMAMYLSNTLIPYEFIAMFSQAPLVLFLSYLQLSTRFSNLFVWLLPVFGPGFLFIIYLRD